ncbi:hypothetical protein L6164_002121 [Bauhinia variegata]|uniref:Uncharacterized protein n=1 Tax=Bauhinia variegata TaxID=167791 RepID=A0ACB9PX77_BAUVA|nr:hypothetical protein L6164_002121 [Bauhinia variegata]
MLNTRDCNTGNTILHLAVMHKQAENIKYLLSLPVIKEAASTENQMGFTALDVFEYSTSDFKRLEFQCLLMEAGIKSKRNSFYGLPLQQNLANDIAVADNVRKHKEKKWGLKCLNHVNRWFQHEDGWLEKTRGNLMIVATVISTMSYQAVIQPPDPLKNGETFGVDFMMYNTISFSASLSVILLLLGGIPLRNKFAVWLLSLVMLVNLTVLAAAYVSGTIAASPKALSAIAESPKGEFAAYKIVTGFSVTIFALLMGLSILFLAIRFSVCIGKMLYRFLKCIVYKIV